MTASIEAPRGAQPRRGALLQIVLVEPEIPQNTGSIGRICVNLGMRLHLVRPLGFSLESKMLRRAGLDYWPHLDKVIHDDWQAFLEAERPPVMRIATTKSDVELYEVEFQRGDHIVFGKESGGVSDSILREHASRLFRIPMPGEHHRSLNLSNAVAIVSYEAFRQLERRGRR